MANEPVFSPVPKDAVYVPEPPIETPVEVNAEVTPPVVEPPAAETPTEPVEVPITDPPVEEPVAEVPPTTTEVIREVEKIVEKYPEMDEFQQTILEYILEGKTKELGQFIAESQRDYTTMSDYDVVKADLLKKNPHYTPEILELKMERQYGDLAKINLDAIPEDKPDEYLAAQAHNQKVDDNLKLLKLDAFEARNVLETGRKEIKLPKITKEEVAVQTEAPTPEAIEAAKKEWAEYVDKGIPEVKEFTYKVENEDVSYKVSDAERNELATFLKAANGNEILQRLGWMDKDGKQNISKIAGDVLKLEKMQTIISNSFKKGQSVGTKDTVAGIKNIDLKNGSNSAVAEQPTDIGKIGFAHLNPK